MDITQAPYYDETVAQLRRDPVVIGLAHGLHGVPRDQLTFPSGGLRSEFLNAANIEYRERGGKFEGPKPLNAVGQAMLSILDNPLTSEEIYYGVNDAYLEGTLRRLETRIKEGAPGAQAVYTEIEAELARRRATG